MAWSELFLFIYYDSWESRLIYFILAPNVVGPEGKVKSFSDAFWLLFPLCHSLKTHISIFPLEVKKPSSWSFHQLNLLSRKRSLPWTVHEKDPNTSTRSKTSLFHFALIMSFVQHSQELLDVKQALFQSKDYPRARSLCDSVSELPHCRLEFWTKSHRLSLFDPASLLATDFYQKSNHSSYSLHYQALVKHKGIETVPFLLARSTASRSLNEPSKALEDALLAKQLDASNPEVSFQKNKPDFWREVKLGILIWLCILNLLSPCSVVSASVKPTYF